MHVVATAGHVDHGKSTLVRALTGMDPDRFAEEKRRGLTLDLGYAWTTIGDDTFAFVDVPGHERFIATMLAGLGPAPAVMFVVAADEGWRRQSGEHLAAVDALELRHGLLVVTRSDLADPAPATSEARARLADSSLGQVPAVAVSGATGAGLDDLRSALVTLARSLPPPRTDQPVRLWVDRSFTIRGAGTVVTGTLGEGVIQVGDQLELRGRTVRGRTVRVRGLQSLGVDRTEVAAFARVAVNLRGVEATEVGRGDALLTPGAWRPTEVLDVATTTPTANLPAELVLHLGTAAVPVRVRPLGDDLARLTLAEPLPAVAGDRLVLRDPGRHAVAAGATVLDAAPPALRRRGAATARARTLTSVVADPAALLRDVLSREGAIRRGDGKPPDGAVVAGEWWVHVDTWRRWQTDLRAALDERARIDPLDPRLSVDAARQAAGVPDRDLLIGAAAAAGLEVADGRVARPGDHDLGAAIESGLAQLTAHLTARPFAAPEKPELDAWVLGVRELAAAERLGRLVRLTPDVVLLPAGPAQAMRVLAGLSQPFTTSTARQALDTTRRVVIPLLEHLDRRGWTVRLDSGHRQVKGSPTGSNRRTVD